jgi:flagellar basal-body rod modification protein FlgD
MQVTSATTASKTSAYTDTTTTATTSTKKSSLDSQDFMKLLAVQFQHQDPMKPMEDTAFIAQMAQFTSLEQSNSLVQQITQLNARQDVVAANSYLGHQVTLSDGKGGIVTGLVSGVEMVGSSPRLVVGDYTYPLSAVLLVEPAPVATVSTPTASDNNPATDETPAA